MKSIHAFILLSILRNTFAQTTYNAVLMDGVNGTQLYFPQSNQSPQNNINYGLEHCKFSIGLSLNNSAYFICDDLLKRFNPADQTTTPCANLITSREGASAAVLNNEIIVCGGRSTLKKDANLLFSCEKYNPITNQWANIASLPTAVAQFAMATLNNNVYVFGGYTGNTSPCSGSSTVYQYDGKCHKEYTHTQLSQRAPMIVHSFVAVRDRRMVYVRMPCCNVICIRCQRIVGQMRGHCLLLEHCILWFCLMVCLGSF
jgi:hypothetical protein